MQPIYQPHPLAEMLPVMGGNEYLALKSDIQTHGVHESIKLYQGMILDGRHRFRACQELDIPPKIEQWTGTDARQYVLSINLKRRHLTAGQRALAAAYMVAMSSRGRNQHTNKGAAVAAPSQEEAAALFDISPDSIQRAKKVLADADPVIIEMVRKDELAIAKAAQVAKLPKKDQLKALRSKKIEILAQAEDIKAKKCAEVRKERIKTIQTRVANNKPLSTAGGPFSLIYADPPWRYEATGKSGSRLRIENQYPTMALEDICALPVASICDDDAMIFMWSPSSLIPHALQVMRAWGFDYSTQLVWHKKGGQVPYMGQVFYQAHETLLVGKRGNGLPVPLSENKVSSVIEAPRTDHSKKPELVYDMLEKMYPESKDNFCELFARNAHEGWSSWGNEAGDADAA